MRARPNRSQWQRNYVAPQPPTPHNDNVLPVYIVVLCFLSVVVAFVLYCRHPANVLCVGRAKLAAGIINCYYEIYATTVVCGVRWGEKVAAARREVPQNGARARSV